MFARPDFQPFSSKQSILVLMTRPRLFDFGLVRTAPHPFDPGDDSHGAVLRLLGSTGRHSEWVCLEAFASKGLVNSLMKE
jgi:hypothetical protein